jgi:hypothetical protein
MGYDKVNIEISLKRYILDILNHTREKSPYFWYYWSRWNILS